MGLTLTLTPTQPLTLHHLRPFTARCPLSAVHCHLLGPDTAVLLLLLTTFLSPAAHTSLTLSTPHHHTLLHAFGRHPEQRHHRPSREANPTQTTHTPSSPPNPRC